MPDILTNLKVFGSDKPDESPLLKLPFFEAMFNPNSYTVNHKLNFDTKQAPGKDGSDPEFKNKETESFSIEFMIDGTGASKPAVPIIAQVALFNKVTSKVNGSTHRPNYLVVQWGSFIRECVLQSSSITYTLFSSVGVPLRAKVNATFLEREESELNAIASMFSSPDLTHTITVQKGDLLPLLTYQIYRDQKYYLQVARVNKVANFRALKPGSQVIFPPLS